MTQDLSRWGLVPELEDIVRRFLTAFPESHVNDGKRDRALQADRMSGLVVAGEVRHAKEPLPRGLIRWGVQTLAKTYLPSKPLYAVMSALNLHPEITDRAGLGVLIGGALAPFSDADLDKLSKHLSGRAVDLQRFGGDRWVLAQAWIAGQTRVKVLYDEGGEPRLHLSLRD